MTDEKVDAEKEFLRQMHGELVYRFIRLQATVIGCTNLHQYFVDNERMKPHVNRIFHSLSHQDAMIPLIDLLESIAAIDGFMIEKFTQKIEEANEQNN